VGFLRHPFFRPVWRRIAVTTLIGLWALVEGLIGSAFWATLLGALAALCLYEYFIAFDPKNYDDA
jgi:hypothetical protein